MAPLRDFDGWVKQVDVQDLTPLQISAVRLLFPYLTPPDRNAVDEEASKLRRTSQATHVLPVYVSNRRFAGDWTLTAKRYFTLANDSRGDDSGTLAAELAAYYDGANGQASIEDFVTRERAAEYGLVHQEKSLLLRLFGTPGSSAAIARLRRNAIWVPYRVTSMRIENVIDLRVPEAQEWFHATFADLQHYLGDELGIEMKQLGTSWSRPKSFFDMLPVLMCPERGGNTITNTIGQKLRLEGAGALIYPSARIRVGVVWDSRETIRRSLGWNLVDYRELSKPFLDALTLFLGVDPWYSEHSEQFKLRTEADGSWLMMPPKYGWPSEKLIVDEDLKLRFDAGKSVFNLIWRYASQTWSGAEPLPANVVLLASRAPESQEILDYMGIAYTRELHDQESHELIGILFECSSMNNSSGRHSKGFAYLPDTVTHPSESLDLESANYTPGQLAIRELESCIYLYYKHEDLSRTGC